MAGQFDTQRARQAGMSDQDINAYMQKRGLTPKQGMGGVLGKAGRAVGDVLNLPSYGMGGVIKDVGEGARGLAKGNLTMDNLAKVSQVSPMVLAGLPGAYRSIKRGVTPYTERQAVMGELPDALGMDRNSLPGMAVGFAGELLTPGLPVGEVLKSTSTGARAMDRLSDATKAVSPRRLLGKAGEKLASEADDYAIKSTRIPTSQQNKFKKITGKEIKDFIKDNNFYGQDLEVVNDAINPLQKARTQAIRGGNKMINPTQIIDDFDAQIAELTKGANALDPSNLRRAKALEQAKNQFADEAVRYAQEIGDNSISQYPLAYVDKARASIDASTPATQFMVDPQGAGNQRAIGGVYRDRVNTTAGTKQAGIQLRDFYAYRDVLEKAPKGKNTLPFGLNKGVYGGVGQAVSNAPFGIGAVAGMAGEAVMNNPGNIGRISKGLGRAGKALQGTGDSKTLGMIGSGIKNLAGTGARVALQDRSKSAFPQTPQQPTPQTQPQKKQVTYKPQIAQNKPKKAVSTKEIKYTPPKNTFNNKSSFGKTFRLKPGSFN